MRCRSVIFAMSATKSAAFAASLLLPCISTLEAASIPIQNHSFELPTTPPDRSWVDGVPANWSIAPAGAGAFVETNASVGFSGGDAAQHGGITEANGAYLYQDLGVPFTPLTRYTIDIASAHRGGFNHAMLNFGLFSSDALGTDLGTPGFADIQGIWSGRMPPNPDADDQFNQLRDASVLATIDINADGIGSLGNVYSFTTGAVPPTGNLVAFIRHQGDGDRVTFDNIRLDATVIPEPATVLLLASCGLALFGRRPLRGWGTARLT